MTATDPDQLFDQWIEFLHVAPEADLPETVYHYTTAAGLFGILNKKAIFLSDRNFLNDRTEIVHGRATATEFIRRDIKGGDDTDSNALLEKTCDLINLDDDARHFIFSMSERGDDLSQWRGYANDGDGYTIGFNPRTMRQASMGRAAPFGFNRVSYSKTQFSSLVTRIRKQFLENYETGADIDNFASCFGGAVEGASCYHKHNSFRYEREWRMVTFAYPEYSEVSVRESSGRITPFVEMALKTDKYEILIKEIGIGPAVRNPNAVTAIRDLCRLHKIDAEIYNASTPFVRY
jgi:hypothetical protein